MKIRKWAVIFSSVCAIASMQLTVNAEADRQALKVALLEYSWENFTSPSMKLGGIENYPMVAYQYSKMDEFMEYYNDHGPSYSNSLDDIDITSDRKMDDFHEAWLDWLEYTGPYANEDADEENGVWELIRDTGTYTFVDAGDTWQLCDAAGNMTESYDKLYQFTYLNEPYENMSPEDYGIYDENEDIMMLDGDSEGEDNLGQERAADSFSSRTGSSNDTDTNKTYHGNDDNATVDHVNPSGDGYYSEDNLSENTTDATTEPTEETTANGTSMRFVVAAVAVVVGGAGGAVFYYWKNKKKS